MDAIHAGCAGGKSAAGVAHPDGIGGIRAADRVRQCGESFVGARSFAHQGSSGTCGVGRQPRAIDPPVPHREYPAGLGRWRGRGVSGRRWNSGPHEIRSRPNPAGHQHPSGWNRVPVSRRRLFASGNSIRDGPCVSKHRPRLASWFTGRRQKRKRGNSQRWFAKRAGDRRVRPGAGASDRSRIADADLPRTQRHKSGTGNAKASSP